MALRVAAVRQAELGRHGHRRGRRAGDHHAGLGLSSGRWAAIVDRRWPAALVCFFATEFVKRRLADRRFARRLRRARRRRHARHAAGRRFSPRPALGGVGYAAGMNMAGAARAQLLGVAAAALWSAAISLGADQGAGRGCRSRCGVGPDEEEEGLDLATHGERAYDQRLTRTGWRPPRRRSRDPARRNLTGSIVV